MTKLSQTDLEKFQDAVKKDYGVELKGEKLYQAAFNLLKFFEALIRFDQKDKENKEVPIQQVRKSSK